jgi:hypothetical protein
MLTTHHPVDFAYTRPELETLFRYAHATEEVWVPKTHHHEKPASCRPCHHAARRS